MKAYLINPAEKAVTEVDVDRSSLADMYRQLDCKMVDLVYLNKHRDCVFVDDEGLYSGAIQRHGMFLVTGEDGTQLPLAGMGMVMGTDTEQGESTAPVATLEEIANMLSFPGTQAIMERGRRGEFG